jgi:hypothetical protein
LAVHGLQIAASAMVMFLSQELDTAQFRTGPQPHTGNSVLHWRQCLGRVFGSSWALAYKCSPNPRLRLATQPIRAKLQ